MDVSAGALVDVSVDALVDVSAVALADASADVLADVSEGGLEEEEGGLPLSGVVEEAVAGWEGAVAAG